MYCIEATTPESRRKMTKKDMAFEMIRMKRNRPVRRTGTDLVYSSLTEAAHEAGVRPCMISHKLKAGEFEYVEDWEPYQDLCVCGDVNEYVLHYIRLYYPELYESSLHVVTPDSDYMKFCEWSGIEPVMVIRDGQWYDTLTDDYVGTVAATGITIEDVKYTVRE